MKRSASSAVGVYSLIFDHLGYDVGRLPVGDSFWCAVPNIVSVIRSDINDLLRLTTFWQDCRFTHNDHRVFCRVRVEDRRGDAVDFWFASFHVPACDGSNDVAYPQVKRVPSVLMWNPLQF